MSLEITNENFAEILANNEYTVVDFWAPWCGPCKMLGPVIEDLVEANEDVAIGKLNIDDHLETALKYGIRGIPTLLFFKKGELVDRISGITSKAALQDKINTLKS